MKSMHSTITKASHDFLTGFLMLNARDREEVMRIIEIKLELDREKRKREFHIVK